MKKLFLLAALTTLVTVVNSQTTEIWDFYYYHGEKMPVKVETSRLVIYVVDSTYKVSYDIQDIMNLQDESLLGDYGLEFIYSYCDEQSYPYVEVGVSIDPENYSNIYNSLNNDTRVYALGRVFGEYGQFVTKEFGIAARSDVDFNEILKFAESLGVNYKRKLSLGGWHEFEATCKSEGDALYCANKFWESGLTTGIDPFCTMAFVLSTAEISAITGDDSKESEFFNLQGQSVTAPVTPGVYIRRMSDGKVKKILVK